MNTTTTYRQKDSGWQIIISYKVNGVWKQKSRQGFPTKREAKEAEADLIKEIKKQPQPIIDGMADITLIDFAKEYTDNRNDLSNGTKLQYIHAVNSLQSLAKKSVNTITYLGLQKAVRGWNMKPSTQRQYKAKLDMLFRAAVKPYRIISSNPMQDIEIAKDRKRKTVTTVTELQYEKIINAITNKEVRMAVIIAWYTGMRRAEVSALNWDSISLMDPSVTVCRQFAEKERKIVERLKSQNGYRVIPIPQDLAKELKAYRKAMPIRLDGNLFTNPYSLYVAMARKLKKFGVNSHWFRHTYATRLLAKGMDVQTVAALLGDDVKTVINTYIHYTDEMRKAAANNIEKIFAENF